jgi:lysophospholipase L1-like esterase
LSIVVDGAAPWGPWRLKSLAASASLAVASVFATVAAQTCGAAEAWSFDFAPGGNAAGAPAYDESRGFGFEPGSTRFSVRIPEGNYLVRVRAQPGGSLQRILAEQRRHIVKDGCIDCRFVVNVRTPALPALPENAGGGTQVRLKPREIGSATWDDRLSLEFFPTATGLRSIAIEPVTVPTLYLAGDSTVTDQARAPNASWGQMLPRFFGDGIAVANHAESGETLKSFLSELRLDKLLSTLRAGDWVMIQFAHNDQKAQWPQTHADAANTYPAYLRAYIAEIRRRGGTPILVTSPERRNFDANGRITPSLADYPDAMRAVARAEKTPLVDLNAMSIAFYEALGPDASARAFADEGRDRTHHDEYGAWSLARMVVEGLRRSDPGLLAGLAAHLAPDTGRFDPAHPDPPPQP